LSCTKLNNTRPEQWTQANKLFKNNTYWKGSDDAYSIKIGNDKVLWLFGDSLISNNGKRTAEACDKMPRNSIGIKTGLNPANAKIKYYWGNNNSITNPESFFRNPDMVKENWLWPGNVIMLPNNEGIIIFFMDIKPIETGYKFDIAGWQAVFIKNYTDSPDKWNIQWLPTDNYSYLKMLVGSGGALVEGDYLYAYSTKSEDFDQHIYIARWPLSIFKNQYPDMSNPEWWTGASGWITESQLKIRKLQPDMLWDKGQTEFTVSKLKNGKYLLIQTTPSTDWEGNADLAYRTAESLTGPWSDLSVIYKNLCRDNPKPKNLMVYAGKLHPELVGGNYIFTFATNTSFIEDLWGQPNLYYPRFLKLNADIFHTQLNHNK